MGPWRAGKDLRLTRVSSGGRVLCRRSPTLSVAYLARNRNFESSSLQQRVCEPSVPRWGRSPSTRRHGAAIPERFLALLAPRAHQGGINVARPIYPRPKPASTCEKRLSLTWRDADYPVDIWRYTSRPFLYSRECLDVGMLQAERNRGNRLVSIHFGR